MMMLPTFECLISVWIHVFMACCECSSIKLFVFVYALSWLKAFGITEKSDIWKNIRIINNFIVLNCVLHFLVNFASTYSTGWPFSDKNFFKISALRLDRSDSIATSSSVLISLTIVSFWWLDFQVSNAYLSFEFKVLVIIYFHKFLSCLTLINLNFKSFRQFCNLLLYEGYVRNSMMFAYLHSSYSWFNKMPNLVIPTR